eukprot:XP_017951369.1 PREDICTED: calcium uniporter protein, mitochondrial-like [Xenopus tropicalis]
MAASAGRSRLLLLSRSSGGGLTAGFPGLGVTRHRPHRTVHQRHPAWLSQRVVFCSTVSPSDDVTVVYQNGLPVISVSLPSRHERCRFTLKPISDSVGVFLQQLQQEDRGIDRVAIYSTDGTRVASATGIEILLLDDFKLSINDKTYYVQPPKRGKCFLQLAKNLNPGLIPKLCSTFHRSPSSACMCISETRPSPMLIISLPAGTALLILQLGLHLCTSNISIYSKVCIASTGKPEQLKFIVLF